MSGTIIQGSTTKLVIDRKAENVRDDFVKDGEKTRDVGIQRDVEDKLLRNRSGFDKKQYIVRDKLQTVTEPVPKRWMSKIQHNRKCNWKFLRLSEGLR